jgi:hypothetical protein
MASHFSIYCVKGRYSVCEEQGEENVDEDDNTRPTD